MFVRLSAWNDSAASHVSYFREIWYWNIFRKSMEKKFKLLLSLTIITGTLHEDRYTFMVISRSFLSTIRNVLGKWCRENQNPHFVYSNNFFENLAVYENVENYGIARQATEDNIIRRNRIPKATNTHSEYVVFITFPLQQWFHERAAVLCYAYIVCLVVPGCRW
jgi:integrase